MLTPQQAFRLFVYADWAMLLMGLAAVGASVGWGLFAVLPRGKGRRKRMLLRALVSFLVVAMFWGTQASVMVAFGNERWTPPLVILFALPVVLMVSGLIASISYGVAAFLRRAGRERRQTVLKSLLWVLVFSVGLAPHTFAMLMPFISAEDHANRPGTLTRVGELVPPFQLTSVDGAPFRMGDLQGHVLVLNFFATWCGPCQQELPHLQAIWDQFQSNDDFCMLVVACRESDDVVNAYRRKHGFTFPIASDPDREVYNKFASQSIPRTYLISRQGAIVFQSTGYYEQELVKLKKLIRKELAKAK